jgi:hypothetical protein
MFQGRLVQQWRPVEWPLMEDFMVPEWVVSPQCG